MKKLLSFLRKSGFMRVVSAILALVINMALPGCQQEDLTMDDLALKSAAIPELTLTYPDEACPGEDFTIVFSSNCGKVMIERGYINGDPILDDQGFTVGYEKIYAGLTCDTEFLQWEAIGNDEFLPCTGSTITGNWQEVGTYVYRVKLNQKAVKNSGCPDCADFKGNRFECFMVTVAECGSGTFTDDRDGHKYKWVKIGDQVWMAENLAYLPVVSGPSTGSETDPFMYVNGYDGTDVEDAKATANYSTFGVLYNWPAALTACPEGWHLPSDTEWTTLTDYLINNGYGYEGSGDDIAKSMAATTNWNWYLMPGTPGNDLAPNNSSGFSGLPGSNRMSAGIFYNVGSIGFWWSSSEYSSNGSWYRRLTNFNSNVNRYISGKGTGFSVRCLNDL